MLTLYRLICQAIVITLSNLLDRADGTVALRADIERLTHERDAEKHRADGLDAELTELYYALDDATRRAEMVTTSSDKSIRENVELITRVEFLERRNAFLESIRNYRREGLAGTLLVNRIVRSARNMAVLDGVPAP